MYFFKHSKQILFTFTKAQSLLSLKQSQRSKFNLFLNFNSFKKNALQRVLKKCLKKYLNKPKFKTFFSFHAFSCFYFESNSFCFISSNSKNFFIWAVVVVVFIVLLLAESIRCDTHFNFWCIVSLCEWIICINKTIKKEIVVFCCC